MVHRFAVIWCLGFLLHASDAFAQPAPSEQPISQESAALAYEPAYTPPPAPPPVPEEKRRIPLNLTVFGSADIGVPVVLDVDHNLIRPGVNLHAQGGLDIGYVAFFLHGGWRFLPVDFERAAKHGNPEFAGEGRDPLKNPYFGFGLRGQVPNNTPFLPYLSASFDMNFWNFRESATACTGSYYYWYCADYNVYKFTPGFSGRVGTAIELDGGLYLDVGLGASMSFEGEFFDDKQLWLEPFAGIGYRR